jgi:hypothetical protein
VSVASFVLVAITAIAALVTVLFAKQSVAQAQNASKALVAAVVELDKIGTELVSVAAAIERSRQQQERANYRDRLVRIGELNEALQGQASQTDPNAGETAWRLQHLNPLVQAGVGLAGALPALRRLDSAHAPIDCVQACAQLRIQVEQALRTHDRIGPLD